MTRRLSFLAAFFRVVDGRTLPAKNELANACPERYDLLVVAIIIGTCWKHNLISQSVCCKEFVDKVVSSRCYFTYRVGYVICDTSLGLAEAQKEMEASRGEGSTELRCQHSLFLSPIGCRQAGRKGV